MSKNVFKNEEINHMLKLEELLYNKFLNLQLLNQLVALYVKAIGYCNDKMAVMKVYFLEKMQFVLSRTETEKLLAENEEEKTEDKYRIKISSLQMEYETPEFVRKSSLGCQKIKRKLSEISDEQQKIRQRESRINQRMEQMHKQISSTTNQCKCLLFSQQITKKDSIRSRVSNGSKQKKLQKDITQQQKNQYNSSIYKFKYYNRRNSLNSSMYQKNEIIQKFNGQKTNKSQLLEFHHFINQKFKILGLSKHQQSNDNKIRKQIKLKKDKKVRFQDQCQQTQQQQTPRIGQKMQMGNKIKINTSNNKYIKKSFMLNQSEDDIKYEHRQIVQQQWNNMELVKQIRKSGVFYSLSNETFAAGYNTPQFSDTSRTNTQPLTFPKHQDQNLTDITQVSQSNIKVNINQTRGSQQVHVINYQHQKEYVDDQYF